MVSAVTLLIDDGRAARVGILGHPGIVGSFDAAAHTAALAARLWPTLPVEGRRRPVRRAAGKPIFCCFLIMIDNDGLLGARIVPAVNEKVWFRS